jgi:hypothetical protein
MRRFSSSFKPCLFHSSLSRPSACLAPVRTSTKGLPFQLFRKQEQGALLGLFLNTEVEAGCLVRSLFEYEVSKRDLTPPASASQISGQVKSSSYLTRLYYKVVRVGRGG